jgi:hypothetical protein
LGGLAEELNSNLDEKGLAPRPFFREMDQNCTKSVSQKKERKEEVGLEIEANLRWKRISVSSGQGDSCS